MTQIEFDIIKIMIDNNAKIIKQGGWEIKKIYKYLRLLNSDYTKENNIETITSLADRKFLVETKKSIQSNLNGTKHTINYSVFRIDENGKEKYLKEINKMIVTTNFEIMVETDIKELDEFLENEETKNSELLLDYANELYSKYQPYVPEFSRNLYGYNPIHDNCYFEDIGTDSIISNLKKIAAKLKSFKATGCVKKDNSFLKNQTNYNNTINNNNNNTNENNINIDISFEAAREAINDMSSLSDKETNEILDKINEIEKIIQGNDSKKQKWSNLKSFMLWLSDKSVDVGIALLPLLLKLN